METDAYLVPNVLKNNSEHDTEYGKLNPRQRVRYLQKQARRIPGVGIPML